MVEIEVPFTGDSNAWWNGRAMAQAVSRRPLTTEVRGSDPGQVHVRFVVDKVALGQVFSPSCRFSSVNFIPLVLH
jgi:hypothetical protein